MVINIRKPITLVCSERCRIDGVSVSNEDTSYLEMCFVFSSLPHSFFTYCDDDSELVLLWDGIKKLHIYVKI